MAAVLVALAVLETVPGQTEEEKVFWNVHT